MRLFAFFIRRPRGITLIAIGIALSGIVAWRSLPLGALPAVDMPTILVTAAMPGASPDTMSRLVASPLERRIGAISGVSEVTSTNVLGATQITVQFDLARNMDGAANDVLAAINSESRELPKDLPEPPIFRKLNPVAAPIMFLAVTSDTTPPGELYDLTQRVIAQKLARVDGVGAAIVRGAEPSAIRITTDNALLASMGLGPEDVRRAVTSAIANGPKGTLQGAHAAFSVSANDQIFNAEDYRDLIVAIRDGRPVHLGDVASVVQDVSNTRTMGLFNGHRAVFVFVQREAGANILATARRVRAALTQIRPWLPASVALDIVADRSDSIEPMLHDTEYSIAVSCVVIVLVIFLALRSGRAAAIASVNIPVSLLGSLAVMWLLGFTLDLLSIAGLGLSVGLVVDDAIVVVENISRLRAAGFGPAAAALRGVRQVGLTIVAITLSLVATLAPLLLVPGPIGVLVGEFAATICVAITLSGLLSLSLTPALCAAFLSREPLAPRRRGPLWRAYAASLRWSLGRPVLLSGITLGLCALTAVLYVVIPKGFLPLQDTGLILGIVNAREDISFTAMAARQSAVAGIIAADPAVSSVSSYLGSADATGESIGRIWVALKPPVVRGVSVTDVIDRLRPVLARMPGAVTALQPVEDLRVGAREGRARFQYTLADDSVDELGEWLPRMLDAVRRLPTVTDAGTDQISSGLLARLEIARDQAAKLGVSTDAIDQTLYDAFGQRQIALISRPLEQNHVVLEAAGGDQFDLGALDRVFVPAANGAQIPLTAVTRLETRIAPVLIAHQGQSPAATISFSLAPGVALGTAVRDIEQVSATLRAPSTLRLSFEGNARAFRTSQLDQAVLFLGALAAVYIVLGVLYESYAHPVTILSTLPSAGLGSLLGLMLFHMELSMIAFVGLLLLTGIVKKNAIILVDFAQYAMRRERIDAAEAMYRACLDRFRPILMTSITAMLGALPCAFTSGLGAEFRRPLGVTVIAGLIVSQVLTLYTTPVIYVLLERRRRTVATTADMPVPASEPAI